jgi:hypothetical protein
MTLSDAYANNTANFVSFPAGTRSFVACSACVVAFCSTMQPVVSRVQLDCERWHHRLSQRHLRTVAGEHVSALCVSSDLSSFRQCRWCSLSFVLVAS